MSGAFAVIILIVGAILVFSFVARRSRRLERRLEESAKAHVPQPPEPAREEAWGRKAPEPSDEEAVWGRKPTPPDEEEEWSRRPMPPVEVVPPRPVEALLPRPVVRRQPAPEPPVTVVPRHKRRPHALFRNRRDLRHAIVAMTVLGPCHALEPYDFGQAGGAATGGPRRGG